MYYQEFLPRPALQPYIHMYGTLKVPLLPEMERIYIPPMPGCGLMMYLEQNAPLLVQNSQYDQFLPQAYLFPQFAESYWFSHHGGWGLFAIIFKPGQIRKFFHIPYAEVVSQPVDLTELGNTQLLDLWEQLKACSNDAGRIKATEQFLLNQLNTATPEIDLVDVSLHHLLANPQNSLDTLADITGKGLRHIRRVFNQELGISPKQFQKVFRINYALQLIQQNHFHKLSEVAYTCGYFDHSHFIMDFKAFVGMSPRAYKARIAGIVDAIHWREEVENERKILHE